jgi:hypothetical protein
MSEPTRTKPKQPQCRGRRADGQPCRSFALPGSLYCYSHSPERQAERDAARRRGGEHRAHSARIERLVPRNLRPVLGTLLVALDETHRGVITPSQAQGMAALASAIVRVYGVAEMDERLKAIEARLAMEEGRTA